MAEKKVTTTWVVFYWPEQHATGLIFEGRADAEACASTRNGLLLHVAGGEIIEAFDYYRRDSDGDPLPAKLRKQVSPDASWPLYGLGGGAV